MVVLPITGCAVLVVINPSGPVHNVFTVTEIFSTGLNSTIQVRLTVDPIGLMGLAGSLVMFTEVGGVTIGMKREGYIHIRTCV